MPGQDVSSKSPTATATATATAVVLRDLEQRASRIVRAIEKCMGTTRSIDEFNKITPAALWSATKKTEIHEENLNDARKGSGARHRQLKNPKHVIESFDMLAHLEKHGIGVAAAHAAAGGANSCCDKGGTSKDLTSTNNQNDPRRIVVQEILRPLARALHDCYKELDRIPAQSTASIAATTATTTTTAAALQQQKGKGTSKVSQPPPPPPGMLSLQNYTDIGAFMEFYVCTSILPFIEPCILFPVEDRARYFLPKSLAGRISRPTLLWGCRQELSHTTVASERKFHVSLLEQVALELMATVIILGRLILLDRFRPMLLPRHLSDLYAAIFQTEVYTRRLEELFRLKPSVVPETGAARESLQLEYHSIVTLLLPPFEGEVTTVNKNPSTVAPVNPALQAQSLQALLLQGTKAPLWLRQRVAVKLTSLACQHLSVIIHVFVHAAPPKDKTAASLRLAHTLVAERQTKQNDNSGGKHDPKFLLYDRLCEQAIQVVDDVISECYCANLICGKKDHLTLKQILGVHTVWAILDQLPPKDMQSKMLYLLSKGMLKATNDDNASLHLSVNRIAILLGTIPPSLNPRKLIEVFFVPIEDTTRGLSMSIVKSTIFGQLLRLSTLPPTVVKSKFRDDVVLSLRLVLNGIICSQFDCDSGEVAAMLLFYSVAPSNWDLSGYSYRIVNTDSECIESETVTGFESISIQQIQESRPSTGTEDSLAPVEHRVKVILEDLISPLIQLTNSATNKMDNKDEVHPKGALLPSVLFHLVLQAYFAPIAIGSISGVNLPSAFQQSTETGSFPKMDLFQIISMCFLPLLCESCSLDHLLSSSENDATGIFQMMQLVFKCAGAYFAPKYIPKLATMSCKEVENAEKQRSFQKSGLFFSKNLNVDERRDAYVMPHDKPSNSNTLDVEILLSVTALLLSLLIAIVELGSGASRSENEEATLNGFVVHLQPIAELSDAASFSSATKMTETLATSSAELAEMAAHAMALLAARKAPSRLTASTLSKTLMTSKEKVEEFFEQVEADLRSAQPPIRARGVVSLQRFLRGDLFQELLSRESKVCSKAPLIVELGDDTENPSSQFASSRALSKVLECAISALADSESYVYLAAVQSIVAATDISPRQVLPSIALAVAAGEFRGQIEKGDEENRMTLSTAQQIKLSEALVFSIRRRAVLDDFLELLLDLMIYEGRDDSKDSEHVFSDYDKVLQIHKETQRYFLKGASDEHDEDEDLEEITERQSLRVNTGGPIFLAEERDVVISSRVAVIAELVFATHPSILAKYCSTLVHISIETLRFDASRPVRRAAAFLALAIYQSVLQEQSALFDMVSMSTGNDAGKCTDLAFTASLVSCGSNDVLETSLQRCLTAKDLHDLSTEKHRVFDSATVARCQEALDANQEGVDGGVFTIAKMVSEARRQQNNFPASRILRELLQATEQDSDIVRALSTLHINTDTLEFS